MFLRMKRSQRRPRNSSGCVLSARRVLSKGRAINISSVGGKIAMATYGPYAGTKFALEAVSDSLRREVAPLGVQVVVVEPAAVRTKIGDRAIDGARAVASALTPEQSGRYGRLVKA